MNNLVAIVGMCGAGKSVASEFFVEHGYKVVYFGGVTMKKLKEKGLDITPENEKMMRELLRKEYGMAAYAIVLLDDIKEELKNGNVVLDGVYSWSELKVLQKEFPNIRVISIVVDKKYRYDRLSKREIRPFTNEEATARDISEIENLEKGGPIAYADYFILNNSSIEKYIESLQQIYSDIEEVE